jgi:hypothetical protein
VTGVCGRITLTLFAPEASVIFASSSGVSFFDKTELTKSEEMAHVESSARAGRAIEAFSSRNARPGDEEFVHIPSSNSSLTTAVAIGRPTFIAPARLTAKIFACRKRQTGGGLHPVGE